MIPTDTKVLKVDYLLSEMVRNRVGDMAQAVEHLPSKHKADFKSSTKKKKKKAWDQRYFRLGFFVCFFQIWECLHIHNEIS
jgi:hypothetical protein